MMTASIVRFARQLVAAAFAIAALFAATNAAAFERQHHLGGGGGLSLLKIDDKSTLDIGAGLGIHYAYGITDQFNLMAEGTTSIVALNEAHGPGVPNTRPGAVDSLAVGISYVFDVIQWVPSWRSMKAFHCLACPFFRWRSKRASPIRARMRASTRSRTRRTSS